MNNLKLNSLIRFLLCITFFVTSCSKGADSKTPTPQDYTKIYGKSLYMLVDRGNATPPEIAKSLELKSTRTYEDLIDLGICYLWMGEYLNSAEIFETAARNATTKTKLMAALYNKAGALAYAGELYLHEAIKTADILAKLDPRNLQIAWLRYSLYEFSADGLGKLVSYEHLLSLDPNLDGGQVIAPIIVVLIVTTVAYVAIATTIIVITPPEDRKDVVIPILVGFGCIAGIAVVATAPGSAVSSMVSPAATVCVNDATELGKTLYQQYNAKVKQ